MFWLFYLHSVMLMSPPKGGGENKPVSLSGGPAAGPELTFTQGANKKIYFGEFNKVSGALESAKVLIGDHLVAINDMQVDVPEKTGEKSSSTDDKLARVEMMMNASSSYPLTFHFVRSGNKTPTPIKLSVTVEKEEDVGCKFGVIETFSSNIVVANFFEVEGPIQRQLNNGCGGTMNRPAILEAVDGHVTPSYITPTMMASVLQRRWENNGHVDLVLCDERCHYWTRTLLNQ